MSVTSQPRAHQHDTRPQRRSLIAMTLAACFLFWVFVFADSGWGPILTPLSARLHISLSTTGLLYVIWSLGYLPGALFGGAMLDRYGPRIVLFAATLIVIVGIACLYLGLLLSALTPFLLLLLIVGLAGIGGGTIDATTNGLISGLYSKHRGTALNLFNLLYPLGGVVLALVDAGLFTLFHNDPLPPLLFTIGFSLLALCSLLTVPRSYRLEDEHSEHSQPPQQASNEIRNTITQSGKQPNLFMALLPVIVAMMFTSGVSSSIRAWTPAYLHVVYGQTPALAAALSGLTWAIAALSRLGAAALIIRLGSWRMIMLGTIITLIGFIAVLLSPNAPLATAAIALTSIGISPIFATFLAIGSERAGRALGAVAGILLFTSGISTVFCGWFFGFLLNSVGPHWSILFCISFVFCGGLLALRLRPN